MEFIDDRPMLRGEFERIVDSFNRNLNERTNEQGISPKDLPV